jgi:hypothetical protein
MIRNLVRQHSVERTVLEFFAATDRRAWTRVRRVLADRVSIDLGSLSSLAPGGCAADDLVAARRRELAHLQAVHHQVGNVRSSVHDDDGHVACSATVFLLLPEAVGNELDLHVGTFDIGLRDSPRGWHLDTLRFRPAFNRRITSTLPFEGTPP